MSDLHEFMNCKCPKCNEEFPVNMVAVIPKEQTITACLSLSSEMISAETLGKFITSFERLQAGVAKNLGCKVHTFVKDISIKEKSLNIEFVILSAGK